MNKFIVVLLAVFLLPAIASAQVTWTPIEMTEDGMDTISARVTFTALIATATQTPAIKIPAGSNLISMMIRSGSATIAHGTDRVSGSISGASFEILLTPRKSDMIGMATATNNFVLDVFEAIPQGSGTTMAWDDLPDIGKYGVYNIPVGENNWYAVRHVSDSTGIATPVTCIVQFTRRRYARNN